MTDISRFLGFNFARGTKSEIMAQVVSRCDQPFSFIITPNVDFVTRAAESAEAKKLYSQATLQICDSRILALLASSLNVTLDCYPGSDIVADLINRHADRAITVVGPSADDWHRLVEAFPSARLSLIPSPRVMTPGATSWQNCIAQAAGEEWEILLICLGSPKQERFAADVAQLRTKNGVAICAGASIDFLTGNQKRAPLWMQRACLEWLYRLGTNPMRLWQRYLLTGPNVLLLLGKYH